jgi:integrase
MSITFTKTNENGTRTYGIEEALQMRGRHRLVGVDCVYLDVRSPTSASWLFWYRFGGKKPELGLGSAFGRDGKATFTAEAKRKAAIHNGALAKGQNPKTHERSAKSFGDLLEEQITLETKSRSTWGEAEVWRGYGRNYFPGLMKMRPRHITRHIVAEQLAKGWDENPTTAGRARYVIERVMTRAQSLELCSFDINPADSDLIVNIMGSRISTDQEEHASVPYVDMPALIARILAPKTGHWSGMGNARKALLVACSIPHRSAEVYKMKRADVDLDKGVWKTPVEDNKKRNVQVNKLPWQVVALLRTIPEVPGNPYFFAGGTVDKPSMTHIASGRMREILQDELKVTVDVDGEIKPATVHGFRSSMITYSGEVRGVDRNTLKDMLSHRPQKGKKKKEALDHYLRPENIEARAGHLQAWCDAIYPTNYLGDNVTRLAA